VIESVGRGGMGIVLKAHDPVLGRIVAVKVLNPAMAKAALARRRFIREARAAAAVSHEHVVTIHAVDEANGLPYLVMQFVSGKSLERRIRETGPLKLEEILRIGMQAASGLAAAHAQGLVHRDIKPANIMLENGVERVKITDFGLARAVDGGGGEDAGVTVTGEISGTPSYMSPEQVRGERVDFRTDLWGLGCVLYAMCAGIPAYGGPTAMSVIRKVCDGEPMPLAEANPSIPPWLTDIVCRLMQKDPGRRPGSAREVAEELEKRLAEVQGRVSVSSSAPRKRRKPVAAALAALMLAVAGIAAAVKWWPPPQRAATGATQPTATTGPMAAAEGDFVVATSSGQRAFPTLSDAVAGAPEGGVVEIHRSGAIRMKRVDLGKKSLTLRAAEGNYPVLSEDPDAPVGVLTTLAPLRLEGLAFAATRPEEKYLPGGIGDALVTAGGELRVLNCRFQLSAPRNSRAACIRLERGAMVRVRNTEMHAPRNMAVHWICEQASELTLENCILSGGMAVAAQKSGPGEAKLTLNGCSAGVGALVFLTPGDVPNGLSVNVRGCVIEAGALLMDGSIESAAARLGAIGWSDSQSLFDLSPSKGRLMMERATEGSNRERGTNSYNADVVFEVPVGARISKGELPSAMDFNLKSVRGPGNQMLPPRRLAGYGAKTSQVGTSAFGSFRKSAAYQEWER
jgi:hypothetical protein